LGSDPISLAEIQSELQARAQLEERVQRAEERAMVAEARAEAAAKTARTLGGTVPQMDASTDPQPSEVQHQDTATEPARVLLRDVATGTTLAALPMPAAEAVPLGGVPLGGEGLPASEDAWRERLAQQQEEIARLDAAIGAAASGSMADASLLEAVPKRSHEESAPAEEAQEALAEAVAEAVARYEEAGVEADPEADPGADLAQSEADAETERALELELERLVEERLSEKLIEHTMERHAAQLREAALEEQVQTLQDDLEKVREQLRRAERARRDADEQLEAARPSASGAGVTDEKREAARVGQAAEPPTEAIDAAVLLAEREQGASLRSELDRMRLALAGARGQEAALRAQLEVHEHAAAERAATEATLERVRGPKPPPPNCWR
jgi:hypothetical protein